jgi:hypothetical protein
MDQFSGLIDRTSFSSVRQYLNSARSPIRDVVFVRNRQLLPRVAELLTGLDALTPEERRRQFTAWLESSDLRVGSHERGAAYTLHLDRIEDDFQCDVLFLPPIYLVHLCDLVPSGRKPW